MNMKKVISIGEAFIDLVSDTKGIGLKTVTKFERVAGGAPANVAACVARLGGDSYFVGKVGNDVFGDFLIDTLKSYNVNTEYTYKTNEANTALAFVSLSEDGDRDFMFYRNPSADMLLNEDEIAPAIFMGNILHFCSVDLIEAPVKYAHKKAIKATIETGGLVSFDPNIRFSLWKSREELKNTIVEFMNFTDILKISADELQFVTGIINSSDAVKFLFTRYSKLKMVLFTKGADGAEVYTRTAAAAHKGYKVKVADTTGAGDAFSGGALYYISLSAKMPERFTDVELKELLDIACGVSAITVTKKGAINSMPDMKEYEAFKENYKR